MSERDKAQGEVPATVEQIAAAMAALGLRGGENTPQEHAGGGRAAQRTGRVPDPVPV